MHAQSPLVSLHVHVHVHVHVCVCICSIEGELLLLTTDIYAMDTHLRQLHHMLTDLTRQRTTMKETSRLGCKSCCGQVATVPGILIV